MHILIIPSWYKNNENPVKGSFFEEQARALQKLGHKVSILFFDFKAFSDNSKCFNNEGLDNGLYTCYYTFKAKIPRNRRLNYYLLNKFAFKKYKSYENAFGIPDIIHAHSVFYGGIIADYLSRQIKRPYVITEHLTRFITGQLSNKVDLSIAKNVFDKCASVILVSESFKNDLLQILNIEQNKIKVIHNMVSEEFFEKSCISQLSPDKPIRFFTNSFISSRKNHKLIIEAFHLFHKEFPNSQLIIGGEAVRIEDINYEREIKRRVVELRLDNCVFFIGPLSRSRVKYELDNCHVFLLASTYETFGVVLIEALACGRPVITTNSKGPIDIVNKNNGLIIESFNPVSFNEGMNFMIKNYPLYDQNSIRKDCYNRFGYKAIMNKVLGVYEQVMTSYKF